MMRTLETAAGIFGLNGNGNSGSGSSHSSGSSANGSAAGGQGHAQQGGSSTDPVEPVVLMVGQAGEPGLRVEHGEVLARPGVKFIAHELCRERLGERAGALSAGGNFMSGAMPNVALILLYVLWASAAWHAGRASLFRPFPLRCCLFAPSFFCCSFLLPRASPSVCSFLWPRAYPLACSFLRPRAYPLPALTARSSLQAPLCATSGGP